MFQAHILSSHTLPTHSLFSWFGACTNVLTLFRWMVLELWRTLFFYFALFFWLNSVKMISVEKGYLNDAKATQNALIRNSFAQQKFVSCSFCSLWRTGLGSASCPPAVEIGLNSSLSDITGCLSGGWHTNSWALQLGSGICHLSPQRIRQNHSHDPIYSLTCHPATCPKAESEVYLVNITNDYPGSVCHIISYQCSQLAVLWLYCFIEDLRSEPLFILWPRLC